jgi:glycosyltransferase involved in cell wall biosynthesis
MKILIIWNNIPSPYDPSSARPFYFLKHSEDYDHDITLISFKRASEKLNYKCEYDLQKYCDRFEIIDVSKEETSFKMRLIHRLKNRFSVQNIFSRDFDVLNHIFYPKMRAKIVNLLKSNNNFDVIYVDRTMLFYILNINTKSLIILEFVDPMLYSWYQLFLYEKRFSKKLLRLLSYHSLKLLEVPKYKKFDAGVYVSSNIKELLKPYLPKRTFIVPYGTDLEYFKPVNINTKFPSLVFTGTMNYLFNVHPIINFCNRIYPLIRKEVQNVKLYIVGRNPTKEITQLASRDDSIIVTGYVEDVRPFLAKAPVVIVPMTIDDGGFKTKILEAMAMGKAVISTSIGAKGLNVTPEENIILADEPEEFAGRVIELLNDEELRNRIGANARKLMEEKYSWEKMTDMLNDAFLEIARVRK